MSTVENKKEDYGPKGPNIPWAFNG